MLIKSQILTQASGSIAGLTGSHNRGGMYFRARTIPTNPATAFQVAVRNIMGQLTSAWMSVLTSVQRAHWQTYDDNVTLINPLGDPIHIGALPHFIRSNVGRMQAGFALIADAPNIYNLGEHGDVVFAATADDQKISFAYTDTDVWCDEDDSLMLCYHSRPQNPTINYFKGPYRFTGFIEGDSITPPTSPEEFDTEFLVAADQLIYCQVRVSRADGRLSTPFRGSCVVAAS